MKSKKLIDNMGIFSRLLANVGAVALFCLMMLTVCDVVGRYLFNSPILAAYESTEFLVLILIFSFIGFTQYRKNHIAVDLIVSILPEKVQFTIDMLNRIICFVMMVIITWMGVEKAFDLKSAGAMSENLGISTYPFSIFLAIGCGILCIEYLKDCFVLVLTRFQGNKS